jgi:hypothetical protein
MKLFSGWLIISVVLILASTGCNTIPEESPILPESTPTEITTPTFWEIETPGVSVPDYFDKYCLPAVEELPIIQSGEHAGWRQYTHEDYGFSFSFPEDWTLKKNGDHFVHVCNASHLVVLQIGFRSASEVGSDPFIGGNYIQRTGVPAGTDFKNGQVVFLNKEVTKYMLQYEGKEKLVLYNLATEIPVADLVFTLSLDPLTSDYEAFELSDDIIGIADDIVESFEQTEIRQPPTPSSSVVDRFIWQSDGLCGYHILRPAAWKISASECRSYTFSNPESPKDQLEFRIINYKVMSEQSSEGIMQQFELFEQDQSLNGWTKSIEERWENSGIQFTLLEIFPQAKIYSVVDPNSSEMQVVAFAVIWLQPLGLELTASGTYANLELLREEGILDDFATMVSSVQAILQDTQNIDPPIE